MYTASVRMSMAGTRVLGLQLEYLDDIRKWIANTG